MSAHLIVLLSATLTFAFPGGDEPQAPAAQPIAAEPAPAPAPKAAGNVSGKISWEGAAPKRKKIEMEDGDPKCHAQHAGKEVLDEVFVVNGDTLQWVFVSVKKGLEGKKFETPKDPVVLDQQGCVYHPHVFGVFANQTIEIRNSDPTMHNIHSYPKKSKLFNEAMPTQGMKINKTFTAKEIVPIKCDVHKWMASYCHVVDHPFFAVSGPDGKWAFAEPLPPGEYEIEAWHEKLPAQTQKVTVTADKPVEANFTFKQQ
jgi:plastocyanin